MKRFKRSFIFFFALLTAVVFFRYQSKTEKNHLTKTEEHSTKPLTKNSPKKMHNLQSPPHSHSHSHHHGNSPQNSPPSNLVIQSNYETDNSSEKTKEYEKQIDLFKRTYFRHLSKKVDVKISVKEVLKDKIILLVRTKNENGIDRSFESIVEKTTGKRIVNQGFSILENRKIAKRLKITPSGFPINKK